MERIIEFPIPDWDEVFVGDTDLKYKARCICYQTNVDKMGYGPYGFITDKAESIIFCLFKELFYFDWESRVLRKNSSVSVRMKGLYIGGNAIKNQELEQKLISYNASELKNSLRRKKGLPVIFSNEAPIILGTYQGELIDAGVVNQLICEGYFCLVVKYYAPQAGQSLVLFEDKDFEKLKVYAQDVSIDYHTASSIDDLRAW